ncbi:hypothetical protein UlMin_020152 [Ulmus minor]
MAGRSTFTRFLLQQKGRKQILNVRFGSHRSLHQSSNSNWRSSLNQELNNSIETPKQSPSVCIYKVPTTLRMARTKAYDPSIVSIGPYHRGSPHLQAMEQVKMEVFRRLFFRNRETLDSAMDALEKLEDQARNCYSENVQLGRDEFVKMLLIDGCFLVEILRETTNPRLKLGSGIIKRWMVPQIQRDLIMLENQLPLFILQELFQLTRNISSQENQSDAISFRHPQTLQRLAVDFFSPLVQGSSNTYSTCLRKNSIKGEHFLDLLRNSILPTGNRLSRQNQIHMVRPISELKLAGIKVEMVENCGPLDISVKKTWTMARKLTIPRLYIDDRRGSLFRNMVAFEKCHKECNPDIATYLFFLDGLVHSLKDIEILHYNDIVHHSFSCDEEVAKFVNSQCKEIGRDAGESYLHSVVDDVNSYSRSFRARNRAWMVRHYFSSWLVGVSTFGAFLALYLTFVQAASSIANHSKSSENKGFYYYIMDTFLFPLGKSYSSSDNRTNVGRS